ncbi:hypothetical protein GE09DRAFT_1181169 [Coniochaeta sp. 2T2.1]|nr:hypothetical protein GE09DRAFT_1181169 [Coniochaeta sp. 2T2.1]
MPPRLIELGELQVTSTASKQSLYLSCSMTLDLPDSIDEQIDAADLAEMTESGHLWIAKAASCRFIWDDLSLKLREEYFKLIDEEEGTTYASFIINHPDLSSEFLSPQNMPCAQLVTVTCDVCYGKRPRQTTATRASRKRKRDEREHDGQEGPNGLWDNLRTPVGFYHEDTTEDEEEDEDQVPTRRHKAGKRKTRATSTTAPEIQDVPPEHQRRTTTEPEAETGAALNDISLLIKSALSKLLGLKTPVRGARVVRNLPTPSLIDIAPAVFNIRYLQAFTSRAEHIPYIASCLSGLDAESPSLRAKIRALVNGEGDLGPVEELEKRLHILVQRGLDVPAIAPKRGRGRAATVEDSQQLEDSQRPDDSQALDWGSQQPEFISHPQDELSQQPEDNTQQPQGFSQQLEEEVPLEQYGWDPEAQQGFLDEFEDGFDFTQEPEHLCSQRPEQPLAQDDPTPWRQGASADNSQQLVLPEEEPPAKWPYLDRPGYRRSQQPSRNWQHPDRDDEQQESPQQAGREWLDLSHARAILDEDGQPMPLAFEDLDHDEYEYELVPLGSDELIPLGSEL